MNNVKLYSEIISLKPLDPRILEIRDKAVQGDQESLEKYVYFSAYRSICADPYVPKDKKKKVFKALITSNVLRVVYG